MSLSTRQQLHGARAMLGWTQQELASRAGISLPTIKRLERGDGALAIRLDTLQKLQTALKKAGIEFIDPNGGGPGVRLRK